MKHSTMKFFLIVGLIAILFLATNPLLAASLYEDNNSPYGEHKAKETGDLLTVIISESSTANQQASTETEQSNEVNVGPGAGELDFVKLFQLSQDDSSSADGSTSQSGSLTAQMTVQVTETLSNGNLKIEGTKEITINAETQKIKVSGIVRPEDITISNTINSTKIANSKIKYVGEGAIGDRQRPGILTKILNIFF
ncbi:flagellar basal body L-ring protein FlgH [Sporohalobacter salinus]|uniref:flagellar basal body L-ring protein FlgH n=1 Tax=Sporohalobacter salinus TaxID=1494606 RepID=UPI0019618210|nr:flagellar basal body L-ring protein FlgH [Sporohalobacter salinus]MBM7622910.1 flagellar L-ring protein precursor FlgH [Sporohalobacter salinus]